MPTIEVGVVIALVVVVETTKGFQRMSFSTLVSKAGLGVEGPSIEVLVGKTAKESIELKDLSKKSCNIESTQELYLDILTTMIVFLR